MIAAAPIVFGGWQVVAPLFNVPLHLLGVFILLLLIRWYSLALRCHLLFRAHHQSLSIHALVVINLACDFMAEWTPAGSGKPLTWFGTLHNHKVPYAIAASTGLLNTFYDWLGLVWLLAFIFSCHLMTHIVALQIALPLLLLGILIAFSLFDVRIIQLISRFPVKKLPVKRVRQPLQHFMQQLHTLSTQTLELSFLKRNMLFLLSVLYWGTRLCFVYLAILMAGQYLPWITAAAIQFLGAITGLITLMPAGFPGADLSIAGLLKSHMELTTALTVVLLWRLMTLYTNLAAGGLAFLWLSYKGTKQSHTQG